MGILKLESRVLRVGALAAIVVAALPAFAESDRAKVHAGGQFVETFDGGSNEGNWSYGTVNGSIELSGGNPGAYFHDPLLDSAIPRARTQFGVSSMFTGDYRAQGVRSVGIDLILLDVDFSAGDRPLSIALYCDNQTPGNFDDDWIAYQVGPENIPLVGEGWKSYDFVIPSQEISLPAGWNTLPLGLSSPPNPDWNDVITNVVQLLFYYGDPEFFFIFQVWDVGMDNPRITTNLAPVPTVSTWGQILCALICLAAGTVTLGKRRCDGVLNL